PRRPHRHRRPSRHRHRRRAPDRRAGDGDRPARLGLADPRRPGGRRGDHDRPHLPPRSRLRAHRAQALGPRRADPEDQRVNALRWRLSPRRKALLATVLLAMVAMLALRWMGVAGFNGTQPREMDWNDDGVATRAEILQGYTIVGVEETREGP